MRPLAQNGNGHTQDISSPDVVALLALGWILSDENRAHRFLDLTGLDAGQLRAGAGDPVLLAATLEFLSRHEPDLLACADALELSPEMLILASQELAR